MFLLKCVAEIKFRQFCFYSLKTHFRNKCFYKQRTATSTKVIKRAVASWPACDESACLAPLSFFCDDSNLHISVFRWLRKPE